MCIRKLNRMAVGSNRHQIHIVSKSSPIQFHIFIYVYILILGFRLCGGVKHTHAHSLSHTWLCVNLEVNVRVCVCV